MQTMAAPLGFIDYGPKNFMVIVPFLYMCAGLGGSLGPITGINVAYKLYYDGKTFAEAFGFYFYIASAASLFNTLLNAYSWVKLRRAVKRLEAL